MYFITLLDSSLKVSFIDRRFLCICSDFCMFLRHCQTLYLIFYLCYFMFSPSSDPRYISLHADLQRILFSFRYFLISTFLSFLRFSTYANNLENLSSLATLSTEWYERVMETLSSHSTSTVSHFSCLDHPYTFSSVFSKLNVL